MSNDQIDELYGKGSLDKIKQYHKDASAISTDSYDAKSYHDASVRRSEFLGKREKAKSDIAKAKKGSTREKGWRNYLQSKDDSERQRNWSQRHRNKLSPAEKRIHNTYLKARGVQEDAPTVNAGSGNIAGIGVGAKGEPGVSPRHQPKKNKSVANPIVASMMRRRSPVMEQEQIDELHGKGSLDNIKGHHEKESEKAFKKSSVFKDSLASMGSKKGTLVAKKDSNERKGEYHQTQANRATRLMKKLKEEQIDELSRKTLSNYIKKASDNRAKNQGEFDFYYKKKNSKKYGKAFRNVLNRRKGIRTATDKLVKEDTFAGAAIFEVSSKLFHNITLQKRKGKHWRTYLEEDDCYAEIREWARKHPKGKIVVRNESTGEMRYVRY